MNDSSYSDVDKDKRERCKCYKPGNNVNYKSNWRGWFTMHLEHTVSLPPTCSPNGASHSVPFTSPGPHFQRLPVGPLSRVVDRVAGVEAGEGREGVDPRAAGPGEGPHEAGDAAQRGGGVGRQGGVRQQLRHQVPGLVDDRQVHAVATHGPLRRTTELRRQNGQEVVHYCSVFAHMLLFFWHVGEVRRNTRKPWLNTQPTRRESQPCFVKHKHASSCAQQINKLRYTTDMHNCTPWANAHTTRHHELKPLFNAQPCTMNHNRLPWTNTHNHTNKHTQTHNHSPTHNHAPTHNHSATQPCTNTQPFTNTQPHPYTLTHNHTPIQNHRPTRDQHTTIDKHNHAPTNNHAPTHNH